MHRRPFRVFCGGAYPQQAQHRNYMRVGYREASIGFGLVTPANPSSRHAELLGTQACAALPARQRMLRFLEQGLDWTRPEQRDTAAADRLNWPVIACYTRLRPPATWPSACDCPGSGPARPDR